MIIFISLLFLNDILAESYTPTATPEYSSSGVVFTEAAAILTETTNPVSRKGS